MRTLLPLLWALLLGRGLNAVPPTLSTYDEGEGEDAGPGGGEGGTPGAWTQFPQFPETPARPRSFPGQPWANDSGTLELSARARALLLGWVPTRLVPALYAVVLGVGLPANGLALWVLATRVPRLPSTLLLMNLAAADLLLALALPPRLAYHLRGQRWPFGEAACRLATAALYGHMYGALLLLAAVSLDRYLAVVHPLRARALRGGRLAAGLCAAAWALAGTLALPLLLQRQTFRLAGSDRVLCHDALPLGAQAWPWRAAFVCLAVLGCFVPLLAMAGAYGASLRALSRAAAGGGRYGPARRLSALVLAAALLFFAPSNVLLLLHYSDPGPRAWGDLYAAYVPCLALSALNSCLDPFLYFYVSAEFRAKVREGLRRRPPAKGHAATSLSSGSQAAACPGTRSSSLV